MTTLPTARRTRGHARRTKPVRRASARLSPVRAGAILAMLLSAAAIYGAGVSPAFGFRTLEVEGARFTETAEIEARLDLDRGTNLFTISSGALEARVRELATVSSAKVGIGLPDRLRIVIAEPEPILVWAAGENRFLVDAAGLVFAPAPATMHETDALPVVSDRRADSAGLAVGSAIDPIDFDAATRIGALVPAEIGSGAAGFAVEVTDEAGFVMRAEPAGWTATFGFYTASLRPPRMIPEQVQLLAGLLSEGESKVATVTLALGDSGSYQPVEEPDPSPKASSKKKRP